MVRMLCAVMVIVCLANSANGQVLVAPANGLRAPVGQIKERATSAEKVFIGTLVTRVEAGGRVDAQLRVDEPIKGVAKGELVKVHWLRIAGYNAVEGQRGLALLLPKQEESYWLRADTFDDVKFADEARKAVAGATTQPDEIAFGEPVAGLRLGLKAVGNAPAGRVNVEVVVQNVSDQPILMLALFVRGATVFFDVTDPDGAKVPYRGPMLDWDVPDYDVAVKELKGNEKITAPLSVVGYAFDKPGEYVITARYVWHNAQPPPGRKPAVWTRGPIWTGQIASAPIREEVVRQRPVPPAGDNLR